MLSPAGARLEKLGVHASRAGPWRSHTPIGLGSTVD
jgi:hypothetical protein